MAKEMVSFYKNLHSTMFSTMTHFSKHMEGCIPCFEKDFSGLCDSDVSPHDLDKAIFERTPRL